MSTTNEIASVMRVANLERGSNNVCINNRQHWHWGDWTIRKISCSWLSCDDNRRHRKFCFRHHTKWYYHCSIEKYSISVLKWFEWFCHTCIFKVWIWLHSDYCEWQWQRWHLDGSIEEYFVSDYEFCNRSNGRWLGNL